MKFSKMKFFVEYDLIKLNYYLALPTNAWIVYKILRNVNSVLRLCLRLRDTALNIKLPFDMCRWLVEGEDVEGVHEVLAKHH